MFVFQGERGDRGELISSGPWSSAGKMMNRGGKTVKYMLHIQEMLQRCSGILLKYNKTSAVKDMR